MNVKIIPIRSRGNVYKLLETSPYPWRATEIFGGELLRNNNDESIYSFYVRKKDLSKWLKYIRNGNNGDTNDTSIVRLFVTESLPKPYENNDKIVNLETLVYDLRHSWAIRYWENHADHIKQIYYGKKSKTKPKRITIDITLAEFKKDESTPPRADLSAVS